MAARYWVGGTTQTWNPTNTTPWSTVSGGSGGASVPTSSDDVYFDNSSGLGGAFPANPNTVRTVTVSGAITCANFYNNFNTNNNSLGLNSASSATTLTVTGDVFPVVSTNYLKLTVSASTVKWTVYHRPTGTTIGTTSYPYLQGTGVLYDCLSTATTPTFNWGGSLWGGVKINLPNGSTFNSNALTEVYEPYGSVSGYYDNSFVVTMGTTSTGSYAVNMNNNYIFVGNGIGSLNDTSTLYFIVPTNPTSATWSNTNSQWRCGRTGAAGNIGIITTLYVAAAQGADAGPLIYVNGCDVGNVYIRNCRQLQASGATTGVYVNTNGNALTVTNASAEAILTTNSKIYVTATSTALSGTANAVYAYNGSTVDFTNAGTVTTTGNLLTTDSSFICPTLTGASSTFTASKTATGSATATGTTWSLSGFSSTNQSASIASLTVGSGGFQFVVNANYLDSDNFLPIYRSNSTTVSNAAATVSITGTTTYRPIAMPLDRTSTSSVLTLTLPSTLAGLTLTNCTFWRTTATGYGSLPLTGTRIGDMGGNTNITPAAGASKYAVATTGAVSSDSATLWALSSGGATSANNFPLPQDDVYFDVNSASAGAVTFTSASPMCIGQLIAASSLVNTLSVDSAASAAARWMVTGGINLQSSSCKFLLAASSQTSRLIFTGSRTGTQTVSGTISSAQSTSTTQSAPIVVFDQVGDVSLSSQLLYCTLDNTTAYLQTATGKSFTSNSLQVGAATQNNINHVLNYCTYNLGTSDVYGQGFTVGASSSVTLSLYNLICSQLANGASPSSYTYSVSVATTSTLSNLKFVTTDTSNASTFTLANGGVTPVFLNIVLQAVAGTSVTNTVSVGRAISTYDMTRAGSSTAVWAITEPSAGVGSLVKLNGGKVNLDYLAVTGVDASPYVSTNPTWYAGTHSTVGGGATGWTLTAAPVASGFMVFMN